MILTIITFIAVLSLLVFVHELGHFWMARRFGLIPKEFGFGFPPRAWGVYKDKNGKWQWVRGRKEVTDAAGTVYSINWLPLGGFVNIGEDDTEVTEDANHFHNKPIYQRTIILLAGVTMNVVLAAALISFGFMIGLPQVLEDLRPEAIISNEQIQVVDVLAGTPADLAEFKIGDIIMGIDSRQFSKTTEVQEYNKAQEGQTVVYQLKRGGEVIEKSVTPIIIEETGEAGAGIGIVESGLVRYPIHIAVWEGTKATILLFATIILAFYELIKGLIQGTTAGAQIAGPVGIAVITGQVARMGFIYILQFAAMLSINLAIINALPFPALDGGRVLFLIIEKIKGSPIKRELEGTIHYIGFALLMVLVLVVTFKDLSRFGDTFRMIWKAIFN